MSPDEPSRGYITLVKGRIVGVTRAKHCTLTCARSEKLPAEVMNPTVDNVYLYEIVPAVLKVAEENDLSRPCQQADNIERLRTTRPQECYWTVWRKW